MTLHLYNTMTGRKEALQPRAANQVGVYVCGVTVWDSTHLGHGRAATVFDLLVRYLRQRGYAVTYVRNYTDVDDKIIHRAQQEGVEWQAIAERFIAEYARDMAAFGNRPPDIEPRASAHIPQMIAQIEALIAAELAYASGGDVFYAVRKFPGYGKLSGKKIEELEVGARIEANEAKRDPLDFALWKAAKPGEPSWPSPWGAGRPGWHIECSAMSIQYLGQPFEIHGGGRDLIFPHHENEIAQAEGATGQEFARCWMHNGSLTLDHEKMSKSLGNIFRTSEALQRFDREVLRFFLLSSHYRSPLDFSEAALDDAGRAVMRVYETTQRLQAVTDDGKGGRPSAAVAGSSGLSSALSTGPAGPAPTDAAVQPLVRALQDFPQQLTAALDDDLNTPKVFAAMFDLVRELNRFLDGGERSATGATTAAWVQHMWTAQRQLLEAVCGIFGSEPAEFLARQAQRHLATQGVDSAAIESLLAERRHARATKDFARADAIRKQLDTMGVVIKDRPDGTTEWRVG